MELSHLRVFVAVARQQNITRAAESMHLTPSPVSRTIRELEKEIGEPLFDRGYHSLLMTPRGEVLLAHAVEILQAADRALGAPGKPLRLAATPWAPTRFARRMRAAAREEWDGAIEFEEAMSSELLPKLQFGELDAALVHLPVEMPAVDVRVVAEYDQVVARFPRSALDVQEAEDPSARPTVLILPVVLQQRTMETVVQQLHQAGYARVEEIAFADLLTVQSRMRRTGDGLFMTRASDTPVGALVNVDELEFEELPSGAERTRLGLAIRRNDAEVLPALLRIADAMAPVGARIEII